MKAGEQQDVILQLEAQQGVRKEMAEVKDVEKT